MSPENFESGRATGWQQALCRQWWIGAAIAWLIAGCGPISHPLQPSVGLRPIPPWHIHEFERYVDSLQPTLQWETFPRQGDFKPDKAGRLPSITSVTYELRVFTGIWIPNRYEFGGLIYSRDGLNEPNHRVEAPLAPGPPYFWMVRAWFELDGRRRVTEWSVRYDPIYAKYYDNRRGWNRSPSNTSNCYNFFTPKK